MAWQQDYVALSAWLPMQATTHLWYVGYSLHLHLRGAGNFNWGGVEYLHTQADEQTGPEGDSLPEAFI